MELHVQGSTPTPWRLLAGVPLVALLLFVLLDAPEWVLWAVPLCALLLLLGALVAPRAQQWPAVGLTAVLLASTSAIGSSDGGPSPFQILFGVLLVGYVSAWYSLSILGGRRLIRSLSDLAYVLFVGGGILVWLPLGLFNGATGVDFRSDLTVLLAFMLFLPAREVCARYKHGPIIIVVFLIGLGVYATMENMFRLYGVLSGARELYEVVDVRVSSGEIQIIGSLFLALLHASTVRSAGVRVLLGGISVLLLAGLVLSKSRGPWLAALIGLAIALALMPSRRRTSVLRGLFIALVAMMLVAWVTLQGQLSLILIGLSRRFSSISSAATQDVSLLNRWAESGAAWRDVLGSPLIGYGWGVSVNRFDWAVKYTYKWSFIHNGYLWILHKTGFVGTGMLAYFLIVNIKASSIFLLNSKLSDVDKTSMAAGVGAMVAFLLLAIPSNPFAVLDQVIVVVLTISLLSGLAMRASAPTKPGLVPWITR